MRRRWVGGATALLLGAALLVAAPGGPAATAGVAPTLAGTVHEPSGAPIADALVAVLDAALLAPVATTVADDTGAYEVDGLADGSYYVYALDPLARHAAAFHGAAGASPVGPSGVGVDVELAPTTGSIAGAVRSEGSEAPIVGAWVLALGPTDGRVVAATQADGAGEYRLDHLPAAPVLLAFLDPSGAHAAEYHDDTSIGGADVVHVPAGGEVVADAALAPTTSPPRDATLAGTITEEESGAPVAGWAVALDATSFQLVGGATAGPDGAWTMPVPAGDHVVIVLDPDGAHSSQWHPDLPHTALGQAAPVEVAAGATATVDEALPATTGALSGTVVEDGSGDPVPGAWVVAITPTGARAAVADAAGAYELDDLPAGGTRATFLGVPGVHPQEYWPDGATIGEAEPFTVPAGGTHVLDASLPVADCATPPPSAAVACQVPAPEPVPGPAWATYTVPQGSHSASVSTGAQAPTPLRFFQTASGRTYHLAFDATARYVLTNPTQPEDQLDWNKLPGLSDCGDLDLSQNGWMFGWRWRLDLEPNVLEVAAYANNDGVHLWSDPLVVLTAAQVDAQLPIWFDMQLSADGEQYTFTARGPGSRVASTTLPRACPATSPTGLKWAGGFYFGGTSTAPTTVTALVHEPG